MIMVIILSKFPLSFKLLGKSQKVKFTLLFSRIATHVSKIYLRTSQPVLMMPITFMLPMFTQRGRRPLRVLAGRALLRA